MELILENYEEFLKENKDVIFSDPVTLFENKVLFESYIKQLAEAIEDEDARKAFIKVAHREREMLLTESSSLLSDNASKAWAIMYYPLLADVYATPVISKILTTFTTNNPQVAIPRKTIKGEIINFDGSKVVIDLPTSKAVRPNKTEVTISEGKSNIFSLIGLTDAKATINTRYFAITEVNLKEVTSSGTENIITVPVVIRADFTGNIYGEFEAVDSDGEKYVGAISGKVDFNKGEIILSHTPIKYSGQSQITFENAKVSCRINVYGEDKGTVRVYVDAQDTIKLKIDQDSSFFIELIAEQVQDLKDIYNLDVLSSAMEVVKLQFVLNKDADIAELLKLSEPEMKKHGNYATVDFSKLPNSFNPSSYADLYSVIVPKILKVKNRIRKIAHVEPQYLLCSPDTATLIESLQNYGLLSNQKGDTLKVGPKGMTIAFTKFDVIVSEAVPNNKIYVVYKAPNKQQAAIIDIVYKPLYIERSNVNGISKTYLKSRTAVEVVDTKKLGCVDLVNIDAVL